MARHTGQVDRCGETAGSGLVQQYALLAELLGVMSRAKFTDALAAQGLQVQALFEGYAALVQLVLPAQINPTIVRDPADDAVLACALAAQADYIVSGDAHLLDLKRYREMPIITAAQAVQAVTDR